MEIKELKSMEEMLTQLDVMQQLYPTLNAKTYASMLGPMIDLGYQQIAVFQNDKCIALSGYWIGCKLWCGKYLEMDNVIVHPAHRTQGAAKYMAEYLEQKALYEDCNILSLDAYTNNFQAHRFYYNQGYEPKGFHFVKTLNEEGLR
ncbi:MAG: GNAT family N-acetyltransferase [Bacteroidetes bacterium]|nr:MAG: GNAT family N-acetyltransferase [Bacteroidota bacterium]